MCSCLIVRLVGCVVLFFRCMRTRHLLLFELFCMLRLMSDVPCVAMGFVNIANIRFVPCGLDSIAYIMPFAWRYRTIRISIALPEMVCFIVRLSICREFSIRYLTFWLMFFLWKLILVIITFIESSQIQHYQLKVIQFKWKMNQESQQTLS